MGPERTAEFLEFTLRTASEGLRSGRSEFLVRDEISAELRHYIETAHQGLLGLAAEHASLIVELAMAARDVLLMAGSAGDRERLERTVGRAREWEHRADGLVSRLRMALRRGNDTGPIYELLTTADDAADRPFQKPVGHAGHHAEAATELDDREALRQPSLHECPLIDLVETEEQRALVSRIDARRVH